MAPIFLATRIRMTSFFPDLNIWLGLSLRTHPHNSAACHLGLLRLLTNSSAMGENVLTLNQAWDVYDRRLEDPRVLFTRSPPTLTWHFGALDLALFEYSRKQHCAAVRPS